MKACVVDKKNQTSKNPLDLIDIELLETHVKHLQEERSDLMKRMNTVKVRVRDAELYLEEETKQNKKAKY